ncbi:MAG: 4Fe-4S dicluster domain-containing protein [Candidatus Pacearchaeota archaeon]
MTKQLDIETNNLIEEVREVLSPCIKCGMCKSLCPVFKSLREESVSPRGKAILLSEKTLDKIVFQCNLCKACEEKCPLNLKICEAIRKAREAMVLSKKELKENKEMIENIRNTGNPFGKNTIKEDGKLYCC